MESEDHARRMINEPRVVTEDTAVRGRAERGGGPATRLKLLVSILTGLALLAITGGLLSRLIAESR